MCWPLTKTAKDVRTCPCASHQLARSCGWVFRTEFSSCSTVGGTSPGQPATRSSEPQVSLICMAFFWTMAPRARDRLRVNTASALRISTCHETRSESKGGPPADQTLIQAASTARDASVTGLRSASCRIKVDAENISASDRLSRRTRSGWPLNSRRRASRKKFRVRNSGNAPVWDRRGPPGFPGCRGIASEKGQFDTDRAVRFWSVC